MFWLVNFRLYGFFLIGIKSGEEIFIKENYKVVIKRITNGCRDCKIIEIFSMVLW